MKTRDNNKIASLAFLYAILIILLAGCADSVTFEEASKVEPVGFWYGLWHGAILPIAWIISLFSEQTAVYAIYNNGGWYDFGFFLGVGGFSATIMSSKK